MRRKFMVLALLVNLLVPFAVPATVRAVDVIDPVCSNPNATERPAICQDKDPGGDPVTGPAGVLATAVNILSLIGAVIAVIVIIIGGAKMITSSGDSNSIASARSTILYAVISLVVIGAAQIGVRFLLSKLNL